MRSKNSRNYSKEFKENAIKQLLLPGSPGLTAVSGKIGIAPSTLFGWKKKCANKSSMKNNNRFQMWTPEQKLKAVIETASMSENELGEYLRANGLHSSDLEEIKKECLPVQSSKGRPKLDPEVANLRKQNKVLERDIRNKDKALAEYSARVILLKKSHEIWGEPEDDE